MSALRLVILVSSAPRRKLRNEITIDRQEIVSASTCEIEVKRVFRVSTLEQGKQVVVRSNRAARRSEDLEQLITKLRLLVSKFLRSVERATEAAGESKVAMIPKRNFQSSVSTHRESRNRSRMAIAQRAELAVNFRDQIFR